MRLYNFLLPNKLSEDVNSFRVLSLNLVEDGNDVFSNISHVLDVSIKGDIEALLETSNAELKKVYRGRYRFALCSEGEGVMPMKLKIDASKRYIIKEKWLKFNDELSDIQDKFERSLI